ncbi:MAG: hypothetical protein IPI81_16390 [Flavobacteriales bacterium]|nr:hypothetical protein [Flavobacteriales bacterium]MCC6939764.1 hypothetical protein [Flavobacteriales bacterium]
MNRIREQKTEDAPQPKKAAPAARLPRGLVSVLNGTFLTKERVLGNMPFILFCTALMVLYIAYGYHTERVVRDLERTGSELKEQRAEYITVRAELEKLERQSNVADRIGALGLHESRVPPVKLTVDEDQLTDTRTP